MQRAADDRQLVAVARERRRDVLEGLLAGDGRADTRSSTRSTNEKLPGTRGAPPVARARDAAVPRRAGSSGRSLCRSPSSISVTAPLRLLDALLELLDGQAALEVVRAQQMDDGGAIAVAGAQRPGRHLAHRGRPRGRPYGESMSAHGVLPHRDRRGRLADHARISAAHQRLLRARGRRRRGLRRRPRADGRRGAGRRRRARRRDARDPRQPARRSPRRRARASARRSTATPTTARTSRATAAPTTSTSACCRSSRAA